MKKTLVLFMLGLSTVLFSQKKADFGKEITPGENYLFQDINFVNTQDNISLYGTLITPKKAFTKVIIIAPGSGPDTRNSHYVLAKELLSQGIAVYRYDERGVGQSEGKYKENATDLYYAIEKLKATGSISEKKVGIIGHSMGGYAALNAYFKEIDFDFLILMATPIEREGMFKKRKFESGHEKSSLENVLRSLKISTLYIAGTEDSFFDADKTVRLLEALGNDKVEVKLMKGLNHFLKAGNDHWRETGDYKLLYEMDQGALIELMNWINKK